MRHLIKACKKLSVHPEHAELHESEGATPAVDNECLDEGSLDPAARDTESSNRDATLAIPSTARRAHDNPAEIAAAPPPYSRCNPSKNFLMAAGDSS